MQIRVTNKAYSAARGAALLALAVLAISGCAERGIQLPESQFLRALESKVGLIAYLGMDGNLYTIDQAGSEQVQITDDVEDLPLEMAYAYRHFAWSPESNSLAYIGFTPEQWTINVAGEAGEEAEQVFGDDSSSPIYLQWNPDGETLSFLTLGDPLATQGAAHVTLHALQADGRGDPVPLADGFPLFFSWEPGGTRALVHIGGGSDDNPEAHISIIDQAGGAARDLGLAPALFQAPSWSPDGTRLLAAVQDARGDNVLAVASLQGQIRESLAMLDSHSAAFAWSPDGRRVAYITSERTRFGVTGYLTVVNLEDPEDSFTTDENLVHAFVWSPDGEKLVYFTQELVSDGDQNNLFYGLAVHFLDVEDQEVRHLQIGKNPFVFQPTPHFRQYLLNFDQYQQTATIWSPDGEYIVIPALTGDQGVILVISESGNLEPRPVVDGLMAFWSSK